MTALPATTMFGTTLYSYDPIDNLRSVDIIGGPVARDYRYNYDGSNRLAEIKNSAGTNVFAFGYDTRGNTTSKNGYTATFDSANRLNAIPGVQTYRYDGLGRRVQTTDADGKTTFWMYSRAGQVIYSSEARRSQNISYLYLGNTQVATRTVAWGTGTITVRYQHTDALGSPVVETDASRNITKRNVFSPWGEAWGTTVVDGTGYTGHVMDAGTGLTYMQQRYYDPQIGRFLSVDPVPTNPNNGANFSSYWYANNNPYRFTDPDGRKSQEEGDDGRRKKPEVSDAVKRMRDTADGKGNQRKGTSESLPALGRPLTPNEAREARKEYPNANTDDARVAENYFSKAGFTPGTIMFLHGSSACADYTTCKGGDDLGWFIHEFGHVDQFQSGVDPIIGHFKMEDPENFGPYLRLEEYKRTATPNGLDTERSADWHMHHYLCSVGREVGC